jgi:predicted acylesterase/phospholipase RssA
MSAGEQHQTESLPFAIDAVHSCLPAKERYALIMKGGGLKGLAFIGAFRELQRFYDFDLYVGTSAGALVAALLGADFSADEMETVLCEKDFMDFIPERFTAITNLIFYGALFKGDKLSAWVEHLLAMKIDSPTRVRFEQLPKAVRIYACRRETDALIFDSVRHPEMSVAHAVRCSIAIPFFFTPEKDQGLNVFDGGMRHNYPVNRLLEETPDKKFIGLYLGDQIYAYRAPNIVRDLISIGTEATDDEALRRYGNETVVIDPKPVSTLDFCLSLEEKRFLLAQGRAAALAFLTKQGHISRGDADKASEQANAARELALAARKRRLSRKRLWPAALVAILIVLVCGWWFFPQKPWSLKNCEDQAKDALRWWDINHSSTFGASALLKCRNPIGYAILGSQAFYRRAYWDAEKYFTEAIDHLSPSEQSDRHTFWRVDLSAVQIENGKYEKAIENLKPIVERNQIEDEFKWDLAKAYVYQGQIDPTSYGLALDTLNTLLNQNYSGTTQAQPTQAGRVQVLRAAAYAGQSLSKGISPSDRETARKRAAESLCEGIQQNEEFWRPILAETRPYPNASFKEEIKLLRSVDAAQCSTLRKQ